MTVAVPTSVYADGETCSDFVMGLRPWYAGLDKENGCEIKMPAKGDDDATTKMIWKIILNLSYDLTVVVGVLALGFIVYGGFKYIMSQGDPGQVAVAKKTLINSIIGLVIALLATVIVNTIITILNSATGS